MDAQGGKTIFCKMARPGQGEGKRGQGMVRAGHREELRGQPECFFPPQPGSWFQRESHAAPETLWPSTSFNIHSIHILGGAHGVSVDAGPSHLRKALSLW